MGEDLNSDIESTHQMLGEKMALECYTDIQCSHITGFQQVKK